MHRTSTRSGFEALGISPTLLSALTRQGIVDPTPIQSQAIPPALEGRDVLGIAQTGTGKTLAFGLPIAERLGRGQQALVLAPTRELAHQILQTLIQLDLRCVLLIGGAPMGGQIRQLREAPEVIVATPGRLQDHLNQFTVKLDRVAIVVLDEADRMLDMGFAPVIRDILSRTPSKRQTLLFSATMPETLEGIAAKHQRSPVRVDVSPSGTVAETIDQELMLVEQADKIETLHGLLRENKGSVLVFARTRHGARKLAKGVRAHGHNVAELHSDRTLAQR